ncbi:unnamed protein product [Paramecium pentaurelia]|uniref:Ankyrin repeat domain-containing protein 54 n=1 Tax=Paramecium pentaurelia TaxID=43138 RepID=A0A8S1Y518_9CILI|nr:unnamed protein product [Paramecium pentaurelia]
MKTKCFSARHYTDNENKEFCNLMSQQQIEERFAIIQKQNSFRQIKRRNTITVRQNKVEDLCILFEKLIKKSNKNKPLKQKYHAICQESGIDFNELRNITRIDDKQDYIIKCCVNQISSQFDNILSKYNINSNTERHSNKNDDQLDLYGWLQVKSQYKSILKRLKFALVDLIQTSNNFKKVNNFLSSKSKINSQQVSFIHTTNNIDSKEQSTQYTSRIQVNTDKKLILNVPELQYSPPELFFEWNKAIEDGYISTGKNMHLMGYETIKKQLANGIHSKKRDKILNKCQQTGNYITEQELQYIASTSFLINKCIDRDFIQRAINCLEDNVKHQIELNISEQILQNFYFIKENQVKIRNKYFEELNKKKRQQITENTKNYERYQHFSKDSLQIRVIKGKFVQYLKEAQKKKFLKEAFDHKKQSALRKLKNSGNPLANIYVQKFKEIMLGIVRKYRERKGTEKIKQQNFLERNTSKQTFKPLFIKGQDEFQLEQVKHIFHPPSKLLTLDPEEKFQQYQKEKIIKWSKSYRLGIRNYNISQNEFMKFYSGGPQTSRQFQSQKLKGLNDHQELELPSQQQWITDEIEVQAANKIKMAIKRFLYKKKFFKVLEKKEQLKSIDIEQRIQKCMKAKRFFEELHKELNNQQNERLKDITQHSPPKLPMDKVVFIPGSTPTSPQINRLSKHKTTEISLVSSRIIKQSDLQKRETNEKQRQKLLNKFVRTRLDGEAKIKNRKLIQAAKMKNLAIAEAAGFHYSKADTELYDQNGNTPLYYSAKYGDEQMTKFLLKIGADVNQVCSNGNTPVHMAFLSGNQQIIIEFINRNGNLNILNNDNYTPLAFGTQELLQSLNLIHCVATVKQDNIKRIDNQHLLHRKIKSETYELNDELILEIKKRG